MPHQPPHAQDTGSGQGLTPPGQGLTETGSETVVGAVAGHSGEGSLGGVQEFHNMKSQHTKNSGGGGAGGGTLRPLPEELAHLTPRLQSAHDGFAALVYQLVCVHGAQVTGMTLTVTLTLITVCSNETML